jgi:Rab GDP dissociation inhibitor
MDLRTMPMRALFEHFGLDENTQSFTGHAMALMRDESYLDAPAINTIRAIKL